MNAEKTEKATDKEVVSKPNAALEVKAAEIPKSAQTAITINIMEARATTEDRSQNKKK